MDAGLIVVIAAVLIFYLRLIVMQREGARRKAQASAPAGKRKKNQKGQRPDSPVYTSILSRNPRDLAIAGAGVLAILLGVLLNARLIPIPAAQPYWWLPTAAGIVAFSWAFKL